MYRVRRNGLEFTWSKLKNRSNKRKHGVSFEEAATIFDDAHALESFDPVNSEDEDRFLLVGMSAGLRVLFVCHCYRENNSTIRIISARKANGQETQDYERYRHHEGPL
ncbi:MAG: BrnT family toxin [Elusimicrobiota bacterium]|nr:BrnT family toxin [Elusimicrobiota bacterium]